MKTLPILLFIFGMHHATSVAHAQGDRVVAARSAALELAGAFSANDGYKMRDGFFSTTLKKGEAKIFAVNLYAGNSYWFCAATEPLAKKITVILYDENGKALAIQPFADGPRGAAGISATYSGTHYLKMSLDETDTTESSTICFVYAYK